MKVVFYKHKMWFGIGIAYSKARVMGKRNPKIYGPMLEVMLGMWVLHLTWGDND